MIRQPQAGDTLGRYLLLEELGRGGMAVVFLGRDLILGREVAIKVMHAHLWANTEYAARFAREARAVAALKHPHIVEIYDYHGGSREEGQDPFPGYIISEVVRGPTLRQFIELHGPPLPEVAAMIAWTLAKALQCAHLRGIVHRDLKPENVMVAEDGRLVLTDFGIARMGEGEDVTQTGALVGSPAYMSPEQARGLRIDSRSDLFTLGTVLYVLCTGALPFPGSDPISTALRILDGSYTPPLKLNPKIGTHLGRIIQKLLQKNPAERYQESGEVIEALGVFLAEVNITDPAQELHQYFNEHDAYDAGLVKRVMNASLRLAQGAAHEGRWPQALAFCDRILAFEPQHQEVLSLIRHLSEKRRRGHWLLVMSILFLFLGVMGYALSHFFRRPVALSGGSSSCDSFSLPTRLSRDSRVFDGLSPGDGLFLASGTPDPQDSGLGLVRKLKRPRWQVPHHARADLGPSLSAIPAMSHPLDQGLRSPSRDTTTHLATDKGQLYVTIGPWCDVFIDGVPAGTSPMRKPLAVTPGAHQVTCRQGKKGPVTHRKVIVEPGQRAEVGGLLAQSVAVQLQLSHGDAVRIDGQVYRAAFSLPPKRYRIDVVRGNQVLSGQWVTIPSTGCILVDHPVLRCQ